MPRLAISLFARPRRSRYSERSNRSCMIPLAIKLEADHASLKPLRLMRFFGGLGSQVASQHRFHQLRQRVNRQLREAEIEPHEVGQDRARGTEHQSHIAL